MAGRVMELTGGRGVEVIVEHIATENLNADFGLIALNGRIVIVGTGTGRGSELTLSLRPAMGRDARILALASGNIGDRVPEVLRRIAPLWSAGRSSPPSGPNCPSIRRGGAETGPEREVFGESRARGVGERRGFQKIRWVLAEFSRDPL